jgi:uridylate kinase
MQTDSPAKRDLKYKRIILKVSGEVLKNPNSGDPPTHLQTAQGNLGYGH